MKYKIEKNTVQETLILQMCIRDRIIAIAFIVFALNHPEMSFPWNNTITWLLYGLYIFVTAMLLIAPKTRK